MSKKDVPAEVAAAEGAPDAGLDVRIASELIDVGDHEIRFCSRFRDSMLSEVAETIRAPGRA